MKFNPKLIEEIDAEVVNRQPSAEERKEISAFIKTYKAKKTRSSSRPDPQRVRA